MKRICILFFVLLPSLFFSACSVVTSVNVEKMINLKTFAVYTKGADFAFSTTVIRSRQEILDFLETNSDKFFWNSDIYLSANMFADNILTYDESFFANSFLIVHGALRDINTGVYYEMLNYNIVNSLVNIEVKRMNPGGGRKIVKNILLFEILKSDIDVVGTNIRILDCSI